MGEAIVITSGKGGVGKLLQLLTWERHLLFKVRKCA